MRCERYSVNYALFSVQRGDVGEEAPQPCRGCPGRTGETEVASRSLAVRAGETKVACLLFDDLYRETTVVSGFAGTFL